MLQAPLEVWNWSCCTCHECSFQGWVLWSCMCFWLMQAMLSICWITKLLCGLSESLAHQWQMPSLISVGIWSILLVDASYTLETFTFGDTQIKKTTEGKPHLGAGLGSSPFFTELYVRVKAERWCEELQLLSPFFRPIRKLPMHMIWWKNGPIWWGELRTLALLSNL